MTDASAVDLAQLAEVVGEQPSPMLFATVSGAPLYGFPSVDSDVDLRGVHVLPAAAVVGLRPGPDTLSRDWVRDGLEMDLVTHDAAKSFRQLLRRIGYVLEQLLSPLVVTSGGAPRAGGARAGLHHAAPRASLPRVRASTQWELFQRTGELKPLLYTFRVLLTGIHLMRSGVVEASLPVLLVLVGAPARYCASQRCNRA